MTPIGKVSRRAVLRNFAGFASLGASGGLAMQFAALAAATPAKAASDYKALVCVYLNGGNDHLDTLIPSDTANYNALAALRSKIIQPKKDLIALPSSTSQNGLSVGLHPGLQRVAQLFAANRVAVISSVGPLEEFVTRNDLEMGRKMPARGFGSHNDGGSTWHTLGIEGTRYGWGGRMLDALVANDAATFASLSVGYYNAFGSGLKTDQFSLNDDGWVNSFAGIDSLSYLGTPLGATTLEKLLRGPASRNVLQQSYTGLANRTLDGVAKLTSAMNASADRFAWKELPRTGTYSNYDVYRDNRLLKQMRVVARLISERATLNATRQVFFVELMGFDTHGGLRVMHNNLMHKLDAALGYFDGCLASMGLTDNVVTFTTSEFGRNLPENGDGTDHGWGGVQFVMGGPVKGGKIYGKLPAIGLKSPDFHPTHATIPTTSVEQVVATLGRWFGVSDSTLGEILPRLGNFSPRYLDFV